MKCSGCKRDFPKAVIDQAGTAQICPICALVQRNRAHGLPDGTPFKGTQARLLYETAIFHLKKTSQSIEQHEIADDKRHLPDGANVGSGGQFFVERRV